MTADFLDALAAGPLDVYGLTEALGIDTGSVVNAMKPLEEAGTVALAPSGVYELTPAGRSEVGSALVASIFAEEHERASLVAAIDAGMAASPHGRVVARIEHGAVVWTAPGWTASTTPTTNALTASAEDATGAAFSRSYPSPFPGRPSRSPRAARLQRSGARPQAARTPGGGSARLDRARALVASAGASRAQEALDAAPDGTTLRLDVGRVR